MPARGLLHGGYQQFDMGRPDFTRRRIRTDTDLIYPSIGSEMIVWGSEVSGVYLNTGLRYDPSGGSWTATTTSNAPIARYLTLPPSGLAAK